MASFVYKMQEVYRMKRRMDILSIIGPDGTDIGLSMAASPFFCNGSSTSAVFVL